MKQQGFIITRRDLRLLLQGLESFVSDYEIGPDDMKQEKELIKKISKLLQEDIK